MPDLDPLAFRSTVLSRARSYVGRRETPQNLGEIVRLSLGGAVRGGRPIGITAGVAWCSAFAGLCLFGADHAAALAWSPEEYVLGEAMSPIGWRAAVWEAVEDARRVGAFVELQAALVPLPGDLLVMGRAGQDPRHRGQLGHLAFLDEVTAASGFLTIGGNEADPLHVEPDGVRRTLRTFGDRVEPVVGWIRLEVAASPAQR